MCYHKVTLKIEDQIDHINSNKNDNSIWNLQLLTANEHVQKTHGGIKLSKPIMRFKFDENNERFDIKEYASIISAAENMKGTSTNIHKVLSGNRKNAYKYYWEYVKAVEDVKLKNEVWKKLL